ncbi:T9SS C-terminal target domain-containing protein [Flavobacteriaceae bacterium PRS1]|nr:T9SS C-terminal target domain-containing protein [Flavobacteriaceae bacterium PRS1]
MSQTITVTDTIDPEIINFPSVDDLCNDLFPTELWADWTDNCADGGTISSGVPVITDLGCYEEAVYTFYVEDDCGNSDTETVTATRYYDDWDNCTTAFGVFTTDGEDGATVDGNSTCFRDDDFRRWGWTNYINTEGEHVLDLYAGAGRCDLYRGTHVGTVTVNYSGTTVTVTYNITNVVNDGIMDYAMSEAHIYIGCDNKYPNIDGTPTVAPGQYTYNSGALDHVYNYKVVFTNVTAPFWIITHAVVCEEVCRCDDDRGNGGSHEGGDAACTEDKVSTETARVDFTAYPVPFDKEVTIKYSFDYDTNVKIEVFDIKGALITSDINYNYVRGTQDKTRIDLSRAANQLFFVRLTTSNGTVVKKIVSSSLKR